LGAWEKAQNPFYAGTEKSIDHRLNLTSPRERACESTLRTTWFKRLTSRGHVFRTAGSWPQKMQKLAKRLLCRRFRGYSLITLKLLLGCSLRLAERVQHKISSLGGCRQMFSDVLFFSTSEPPVFCSVVDKRRAERCPSKPIGYVSPTYNLDAPT
jgi:hypothetical protein